MNKVTESAIETLAIELFEKLGYPYLYAPNIAPHLYPLPAGEHNQRNLL